MATLKTAVFTLHDESTLTVADTASALDAKGALSEFLAYKTAKIVAEGKTYYVPFHSVVKVEVTESTQEETAVEDAFCPTGKDGE